MTHHRAALALALAFLAHPLAAAPEAGPLVTPDWLVENGADENVVIVDIRDGTAEDGPFVPGAVLAPYGAAGWRTTLDGIPYEVPPRAQISALVRSLGIDDDDRVVIVPEGSSSTEFAGATRVYWTLRHLGHEAISILDGGFRAYAAADAPLAQAPARPGEGDFFTDPNLAILSTLDDVAAALRGDTVLVDARPEAQFAGRETSRIVARAGTIPGARNLPHSALYDAEAMRFADADELRALTEAAGIPLGGEMIAFCNTGHWGSIAWFALSEVLGQRVSLYDGSMAEWAADPDRPVE